MGPEWVAIIALVALFVVGTVLPINMGALAYVAAWLVGMYALDLDVELPRVDVIACHLGMDAALLHAAVAAGAAGIVLEALGAGNVPPPVAEAVGRLVAGGTPVLVCSRVPSGPVVPLYDGGGASLARGGALFAGDMSPWQARMLLMAALAVAPGDPLRVVADHLAP